MTTSEPATESSRARVPALLLRECREPFEAAPDLYAGGENRRGVRQLKQLHG
jgi:hypothetical protein